MVLGPHFYEMYSISAAKIDYLPKKRVYKDITRKSNMHGHLLDL